MQRAPFIWADRQAFNADGFFAAVRGAPPRQDGLNRWFLFRRRFVLKQRPRTCQLDTVCDGKYQLFVNGQRIGRGPVRCSPLNLRYDRYDDPAPFRAGDNVIAFLVHCYGVDTAFYEGVRGLWRETFGEGALWLDACFDLGDEQFPLQSDLLWRAIESDAWDSSTPQMNSGLGFVESLDARKLPEGWTLAGFDDRAWGGVRILEAGGGGPEARFGGAMTRPFPVMQKNTLPQQAEALVPPRRLVWAREAELRELPIVEQAYAEPLGRALGDARVLEKALVGGGEDALVRTPPGGGVCFLLDFGRIEAGRPRLEIEARGGEEFDLVVSERLPGEFEDSGIAEDARIERRPLLGLDAHVSRYVARPGQQVFEAFEWDAVRWMQVTVRNAPKGVHILSVDLVSTRYPAEARGAFRCSDPVLTQLWELGRRTLELCMHDGWIDCPGREQRQWLGDATVEHLVGEATFGPSIHPLNAFFLVSAAESQRRDGLLEMFAPGDYRRFGWLIPDFTLQWVFNCGDHFAYSGDAALMRALFPTMLKALAWFERLQADDGRIADLPYWHFQDWAAVGRTGYATVLNAQLCGAFLVATDIARALGWDAEAKRLEHKAAVLQGALEAHWDDVRQLYVDCVDPISGEREPRVSQHTNAAMILWGGAPRARWDAIAARISDPTRLKVTPAPPVTLGGEPMDIDADIVLANTFYSHFVFAALAKTGQFDRALALMRNRYGKMLARGATSLWEGFEPHASLAHGFSATPTWQLSRHVLGVVPDGAGFEKVAVAPNLCDLDFAEGVVPTRRGDIAVSLVRRDRGFEAQIALPDGLVGRVLAPAGCVLDGEASLSPGLNKRSFQRMKEADDGS